MRSRTTIAGWAAPALLLTLLLAAGLGGCESTDFTAPSDGQLVITITPSTAAVDSASGRGRATVSVTVLDAGNFPLESVAVTLSSSGGTLSDNRCSGGSCDLGGSCSGDVDCALPAGAPVIIETDANGRASRGIVVTAADPASVTVTAQSGSLSSSGDLTNPLGTPNSPPDAEFEIAPPSPVDAPRTVTIDAFATSDPDGDAITCYQWELHTSTGGGTAAVRLEPTFFAPNSAPNSALCCGTQDCFNPAVAATCIMYQGRTLAALDFDVTREQALTITLRVSDDPLAAPCNRSALVDPDLFSPDQRTISQYWICNNSRPVADAGADQVVSLSTNNGQATLNGSAVDLETTNVSDFTFDWECGNGNDFDDQQVAVCTYTVVGNYVARLTVTDSGANNQKLGPCLESDTDTAIISVVP